MLKFEDNQLLQITYNPYNADLITHNGTFHADEVFATIVLIELIKKESVIIYRTSTVPDDANALVYDVGLGKFDHHQVGGNGAREDGTKYASFGLIWKEFGKVYLKKIGVDENDIDNMWQRLDLAIVENIDSGDNGQLEKIYSYEFDCLGIADLVNLFNSNWNEEENQDNKFVEAVNSMRTIFQKLVQNLYAKVLAQKIIEEKIDSSNDSILILDEHLPWKDLVLESKSPKAKELLYIIFPSNRGGYNVYAIPDRKGSFDVRKHFPKSWAGLRDEELQDVTGIKTARFCHNARFICACEDLDGAIEIAKKAVDYNNKEVD